jgi:hypothetical protein
VTGRTQGAARVTMAACLALAPFRVQCAVASDARRPNMATTGALQAQVEQALRDAAQRTQLDRARLRVMLAEPVTWPDGALGCPAPGREYSQALVAGYRIHIDAGGRTLQYHGSLKGQPFLCPTERVQPPSALGPST